MTDQSSENEGRPLPAVDDVCWFLSGSTASGKTTAAVALALEIDAEIISLDSMTIYRGLDIGTAKPTREEQGVPHHMLDIRDPVDEFSVAQYLEMAHQLVSDIQQRGRVPLFVGGTPMYLKVLLRGMFTGPPADWEFREQIQQQWEIHGNQAVHQQLERVDPLSAHKIHPNDMRRITRALEVFHLTGEPISHQQQQFEDQGGSDKENVFVLGWPRPQLHRRIDRRVEQMFEVGFVQEVELLQQKYTELGRTAAQAVGYREVLRYLRGELTLAETMEQVKVRTRRFARRQETWFRGFAECKWIMMNDQMQDRDVVEAILAQSRRV